MNEPNKTLDLFESPWIDAVSINYLNSNHLSLGYEILWSDVWSVINRYNPNLFWSYDAESVFYRPTAEPVFFRAMASAVVKSLEILIVCLLLSMTWKSPHYHPQPFCIRCNTEFNSRYHNRYWFGYLILSPLFAKSLIYRWVPLACQTSKHGEGWGFRIEAHPFCPRKMRFLINL